ncbi:MAG: hypothetical protein OXG44_10460 [Gammaproteobacteria bacterium]|nr:hypothetical protein [Gammaproteobacteria bacterium]
MDLSNAYILSPAQVSAVKTAARVEDILAGIDDAEGLAHVGELIIDCAMTN